MHTEPNKLVSTFHRQPLYIYISNDFLKLSYLQVGIDRKSLGIFHVSSMPLSLYFFIGRLNKKEVCSMICESKHWLNVSSLSFFFIQYLKKGRKYVLNNRESKKVETDPWWTHRHTFLVSIVFSLVSVHFFNSSIGFLCSSILLLVPSIILKMLRILKHTEIGTKQF